MHEAELLQQALALEAQGRWVEAAEAYRLFLRAVPHARDVYLNLAMCLQQQRRFQEAFGACEQATKLDPNFAEAIANLGNLARLMARDGEAIEYFERARTLDPGYAELRNTLGVMYKNVGRLDDAINEFRRALELSPREHRYESNLLYATLFLHADDPQRVYEAHLDWAQRCATPLLNRFEFSRRDRSPDRPLRIGYVSAYFKQHAVNYFVEPILEVHDRKQFQVFCYSDTDRADAVNQRLRTFANGGWRDVRGMSDEQVAQAIHEDAIDILVDLSGHLATNRLLAFARKPAPVQATYIGYQATTGLPNMDWRLSDDWCDPPGQTERWHTEKLARLSGAFFCYKPSAAASYEVGPLPADRNGFVTFGCFNNFTKVSPQSLSVWSNLLRAVPNSRLMLLCPDYDWSRQHVLKQLQDVDPARITFAGWASRRDYLNRYNQIDIALDPIPFNGHTTTCDALWMGVPVVTLAGSSYVSRYGAVAIKAVGLDELVTRDVGQYIAAATRLAQDLDRLRALRSTLRDRLTKSVVCDANAFSATLAACYRNMWRDWCGVRPA